MFDSVGVGDVEDSNLHILYLLTPHGDWVLDKIR